MYITVEPGTYVVAVSGGVDSMALLDMLRKQPELRLIVAHFDHGIRPDSKLDKELVQKVAQSHGLPFVFHEGRLGLGTSEARARKARYNFLHKVRKAAGAQAVVTAHHQDDLLETAIHNLLRGTGRKGLSSLSNRPHVVRPLINIPKQALVAYATGKNLKWREDSTNQDTNYKRNYIRHNLMPLFNDEHTQTLLGHIRQAQQLNHEIEHQLINHLHTHPSTHTLNKLTFIRLPHKAALEVMASWLRNNGVRQFDRKLLEKLVIAAKTYKPGKRSHVDRLHDLAISKTQLALETQDR